jgi:transcriptional regulator with XRE-family HTH domain
MPSTNSRYAVDAAQLLGAQIKLARKQRRWPESALAERMGVSRETVRQIEAGALTVAIGAVFEAAVVCGVPLFIDSDQDVYDRHRHEQLRGQLYSIRTHLALLPKRIRKRSSDMPSDKF